MKFDLSAEVRSSAGKGAARQLRRQGKLPAVLYGHGECLLVTLDPEALKIILRSRASSTALITLTVAGASAKAKRTAMLRDYQVDPVTGEVLHADLFEISMDKAIRVKVPVSVIGGTPAGVKEGGLLHHNLRELHIECLPSALPDSVQVDASPLMIGQGIHVKELHQILGVRFLDEPDQMVVSVAAPMSEAKLEALLTSAAAEIKEPEVIPKGKEEPVDAAAAAAAAAPEKGAAPGEAKAAAGAAGAPATAEKKEGKEAKEAPKADKKEGKADKKEGKEEKKK